MGADLADMQLINKFNKGFRFLLCGWVVPLKDKKGITIANAFHKILKEPNRRPNIIWVDNESEFYNRSFEKWLKVNDIEMYQIHNEGKSVVAETFIRKIYQD